MLNNNLSLLFKPRDLNAISREKRLFNIESFSNLDRSTPLKFGEIERLLSITRTSFGEEIYIRYPGKESARPKNCRPLDFRPVLKTREGYWLKDLSFGDIWDDITQLHVQDPQTLSELAAIFFRMAYLVDTRLVSEKLSFEDIETNSFKVVNHGFETLKYYKLTIPQDVLNDLSNKIGLIRGVSLEGYLIYNDLLVQNEDVKYFYRNKVETPNKKWNFNNGRLNTILSHLSVIEFLQDRITFSQITMRFQRGMGVAPITNANEISLITNGLISKRTK